jgi:hypothetical protein
VCNVVNGADKPISVTRDIFDSTGTPRVIADRSVAANGMTSVEAYDEFMVGNFIDRELVNRGFCRVTGKMSRQTTKVAFEQCFLQVLTGREAHCSAAVSAR